MLWTTLKQKIKDVHGDVIDGIPVDSIDIRRVAALRERFPDLFPKYLRTRTLRATHDSRGRWIITR